MFVTRTTGQTLTGNKTSPEFRITGFTTTISSNDTLTLYPISNGGSTGVTVGSGVNYRISLVSQFSILVDASTSTYSDYSNIAVDSENSNFTSIIFTFSKNIHISSNNSIPEYSLSLIHI